MEFTLFVFMMDSQQEVNELLNNNNWSLLRIIFNGNPEVYLFSELFITKSFGVENEFWTLY